MATIEGAWVPNGSASARMRLRTLVSVPTPAVGQTTITVTGSCWLDGGPNSFYDSSNVFTQAGSLLGSASGSKSINLSSNGSQQLMTFSKVVTLTSATQGFSLAFSLSGVDYVGATASVSTTVSVPAKVETESSTVAPNPPTAVTFSYGSDSNIVVTVTAAEATNKPIETVRLIRQRTGYSDELVGNLTFSGTGVSIRDTATVRESQYRWGARTVNSAGFSVYVYSAWIKTTPTQGPYNLVLARTGSTVSASWYQPGSAALWDRQEIRWQYDNASADWSGWSNLSAAVSSTSFPPLTPVVRVQVRGVTTTGLTLYSAPALSAWIVSLAKPNAPTPVLPATTSLVGPSTFYWRHNPVDGTGQTGASLTWRVNGGVWNSVTIVGSDNTKVVTLPAGRIEWQVVTRGEFEEFSLPSVIKSFMVANRPTLTIDTPVAGTPINSNRLTVGISYSDASGAPMVGWQRQLVLDGVVIEDVSGTGVASSLKFSTVLANTTSYTANVWVTSSNGLTSNVASRVISTDFQLPYVPVLDGALWKPETGTMYLSVSSPVVAGKVAPASVRIERSEDSGQSWELVEEGLPASSGIGDGRVPLNLDPPAMWRAVSVAPLGTESVGTSITVASPSNRVMISNGDALLSFLVDIGLGAVEGHEVVFEDYLGQESPTAHFGVSRPVSAAVTGTLLRSSDRSIFKKLLGTEVFYRDPDSRAFVAVLDEGGFSSTSKGPRSKQVAYNVRKVTPYG